MSATGSVLLLGCAGQVDDSVEALVRVVGSALTSGSVKAINGTYAGCVSRSGNWSVRVSGTDPLAYSPLSVVTHDSTCQLTITELVADQTYTGSPTIALTTSFKATASGFMAAAATDASFYANAKVDSATFSTDFTISVLDSDDPSSTDSGQVTGTYATVQASAVATIVSAPNYTFSMTAGGGMTFQLDAAKVVQSVSGQATLTDGTVTGSAYVVDQNTLGASPTFATVGLAYALGTEHPYTGANPTIPATYFGLVGQNLTSAVVRTVIVSRTVSGIKSYQLFKVTFKSP